LLALTPCSIEGVEGSVSCGTLQVWENRASKVGRKIPLNFVVLRALSPHPLPDPLFTFAGGPGQAEAADAKDNAERFAAIRQERDIVMIDQRGTGRSNPLNCSFGNRADLVQVFLAGNLPLERVRDCRKQLEKKADLRFYTTPIAMDDADEVRRRLGYGKINLYGGSYGSRAALVYMARHPKQVRTATLRAIFPLSLRNPLHSPRDAQHSLERLFADCAADPACSASYPTLPQDLDAVLANLAAKPATLSLKSVKTTESEDVVITRDVFAGIVRRMLYHPRTQANLPLVVRGALAKDYAALQPLVAQASSIEQAFSMGMFLSVTCAEDTPLIRPGDVERATAGTMVGKAMVRSTVDACEIWPRGKLPKDYHQPVRSHAPVLLFSGALDPMTPAHYGSQVARTLPKARHLVMEGVAHSPFPPCAIGIMTQLIITGSTSVLETSCTAELRRPPFKMP
jgi:pimeloyl-ACP methyl ester carboxylesterase